MQDADRNFTNASRKAAMTKLCKDEKEALIAGGLKIQVLV